MADRVIRVLSKPETPPKISTAEIGKLIGVNWRNAASRIPTPEFFGSLEAVGWRHIKGSGRAPHASSGRRLILQPPRSRYCRLPL